MISNYEKDSGLELRLASPWVVSTLTRSRVSNLNDVSSPDTHVEPVSLRRRTLPVTRVATALRLQIFKRSVEVTQPRGLHRIVLVLVLEK